MKDILTKEQRETVERAGAVGMLDKASMLAEIGND
jgi:hypothetical protein